jgi:23S rRNA pseudouridine2605 synthase
MVGCTKFERVVLALYCFHLSGRACTSRMVTKLTHAPLHRLLSKLGLASRTQAVELVGAGRVRVNGQVVHDPALWSAWDSLVEIDRAVVQASVAQMFCLHKRRGVVTARVDAREKVVCDHPMLRDTGCGPVGRLDKASEGLLLFTNDTRLANRLTSPEAHLPKVYEVRLDRPLRSGELEALGADIDLGGELTSRSTWTSMEEERNPSWVRVQLREGKNRQIRRMLGVLGVGVQRLIRTAIGPLQLGSLARGAARALDEEEARALRRAVSP